MDFNHINIFLDKFKKILFQKEVSLSLIADTITKHIGYSIDTKNIKTKGNIIYVQSSPMLRSEILIHKETILSDLNNSITGSCFRDIR